MKKVLTLIAVVAALGVATSGCTTISTGLSDTSNGQVTGTVAKGAATAVYLFGMFPLAEGQDAQAAYRQALSNSGAKGLRAATMQTTIMNLWVIQLEFIKVHGQPVK